MAKKSFLTALSILALGLIGCDLAIDGGSGSADDYPAKTISLICPWAAGGGTDRLSRFMADQLQRRMGKPVVVVNRTGGSGAAGHSAGALARPDGYTVTMGTFELSTMHWMGISDLTHTNFTPVIQLNADAAALLVNAASPWQSLDDLLAHIKQNPGKLKMSGTSTGGAWDLARAGFLLAAGLPVDSVLWVPTQGSAPSLVELLGGHIDAVCCSVPEAASQIEAKQLKVLAVMAPERLPEFPDLPTVRDRGIEWDAVGWRGLVVPRGTPEGIVKTLYRHCREIVDSEDYTSFMRKNGFAIAIRDGAAFETFLAAQDAQWQHVIEAAGYARQ